LKEEVPDCPHCGGKSDGSVMYSEPPQTTCIDCKKTYEFGEGIKILTEEEGRAKRPGMYEGGSERKRIVEWLRLWAQAPLELSKEYNMTMEACADAIEKGYHWK